MPACAAARLIFAVCLLYDALDATLPITLFPCPFAITPDSAVERDDPGSALMVRNDSGVFLEYHEGRGMVRGGLWELRVDGLEMCTSANESKVENGMTRRAMRCGKLAQFYHNNIVFLNSTVSLAKYVYVLLQLDTILSNCVSK